ncbi:MAG: glycosyltransferase 61 family protein [Alphaproteobacteria bacterium]|nr:glycosyltransferase 61 family protein [Alphaproteobacteria bacterium]
MRKASPPRVGDVLDAAETAISRGEIARAGRWLGRVQDAAPSNHRLYHLKALIHRAMERDDLAIVDLTRSLVLRPDNAVTASRRGVLLKARGDMLGACAAQTWATVVEPVNPGLLYNLANVLVDIARPEKALGVLLGALDIAPLDTRFYRLLASARLAMGRNRQALGAAKRSILISPELNRSYLSASRVAWESEDLDLACIVLDWAFRLSPLDQETASNRARLALELADAGTATMVSRRGVIAAPGAVTPMLGLCAGLLEVEGFVASSWERLLCIIGIFSGLAKDFSARRVVGWRALSDPTRCPVGIEINLPENVSVDQAGAIGRFLLTARDVTILPKSQAVLTSGGEVMHEGLSPFTTMADITKTGEIFHWNPRGSAVMRDPRPVSVIPNAILLGMGGHGNYYHWLIDFLPRLYTVEQFRHLLDDPAPFLISDDCPLAIRELLTYLGLRESDLVAVPSAGPVAVETLKIPAMPSFSDPVLEVSIRYIRAALADRVKQWTTSADASLSGVLVYMDRGNASQRRLLNEAAVTSVLRKRGFTIFSPDPGSIRQQIMGLHRARVLVSAHGAGMANMIFAPPGCEIIELGQGSEMPRHLTALAMACGHRHRSVTCEMSPNLDRRQGRWDMRVPLDDLEASLSTVLN